MAKRLIPALSRRRGSTVPNYCWHTNYLITSTDSFVKRLKDNQAHVEGEEAVVQNFWKV
jgi:hypothetical protein